MFKLRYNFKNGDRVRHRSGKTATVVFQTTWAVWVLTDHGHTEPWSKDATAHEYPPVFRSMMESVMRFLKL